jgi:hypothetical protein
MKEYIVWIAVHLGVLWLMLLAAAGLGHAFLRKHEFDSLSERLVFTLAVGLGLASLLIFALGLVGLLYPSVLLALTILGDLGTIAYLIHLYKSRRLPKLPSWRQYYSLRGAANIFLVTAGLAYWSLLLLPTQYPPIHWDSLMHHLVLCREYLAAHRLVEVPGISYPVIQALNHMLFTWGMALLDEVLAQMIEHTFLMLTAAGLYTWGKREKRPLLGLAAATFWLANPLVLWLGASAYVDVCLAGYVFLGIYALRLFCDNREPKWWYLAMALLGMAAGVKVTGLFFVLIGSLLGLWVLAEPWLKRRLSALRKKDGKQIENQPSPFSWKAMIWGWAIAFLMLLPWYAYFTYYTGNPVWPAFSQFSRGQWGAPAVVANLTNWYQYAAEPRTIENFLMLPIDWIRYPGRFYAENALTLYPLIMAWPVAWVFALWNRSVRWWAFWALSFTFYWFLFSHQLRYLLPVLPFAALALYESLRWVMDKISRTVVWQALVWIGLIISATAWGARATINDVSVRGRIPVDAKQREAFLATMSGYKGVQYINKRISKNDRICLINANWMNYYFTGQVLDLFAPLQAGRLPTFRWPDDELWVRWLETQNVEWIYVCHANAPSFLAIPKRDIVAQPIWPDYQLVYVDPMIWIFRHKPVPPDISLN